MTTRRNFLKGLGAGLALYATGSATPARAASARVVVVGGGTAGVTVAKYLRLADPSIAVTLLEPNPRYTTCYMSNEVLVGDRTLEAITFGYQGLEAHGVTVVPEAAVAIDPVGRSVTTDSGARLSFDRCVVAPGVDFRWETIDGYSEAVAQSIPHAWKAGPQTELLRNQLAAMEDGGTVVIAAPPNPYRCPPAPYERASLIASYLQRHKPHSKVVILDPKSSFAKQALFEQAWSELYGYGGANALIEWHSADSAAGVVAVDPASRTVRTEFGDSITAQVLNLIPAQQAGKVAWLADLVDATGWCPVDRQTFESTRHPAIHVIGDACIADALPKSGYAANSEAKVCASAIVALLNGATPPSPSFSNGCYSIVAPDYAISIVGIYRLSDDGELIEPVAGSGGTSPLTATPEQRKFEAEFAYGWYHNFTRDLFY